MKNKLNIILTVTALFLSMFVGANNERLKFIHYSNEDGLPSSYIRGISQDKYGFIWLATRSSVCRFDGKYFKTFQAVDDDGSSYDIWGKKIYCFHDSLLIVQSTNNDFFSFNFELERFEPYDILNDIGDVRNLEESKDGFWAHSNDSLYFLNLETQKTLSFNDKIDFAQIPKFSKILNVRERNGRLIATTNTRDLLVLDIDQKQQWELKLPDEIIIDINATIFFDKNNHVWIVGLEQGIFRINLTNGHYVQFSAKLSGNKHLLHDMVHTVSEDHLGRIWIGTEDGLCVWSPRKETMDLYQKDIYQPQGLNTNPVYKVFCDKEGNMWLGTYFGGINFWNSSTEFFTVWQAGTSNQHLSGSAVSCITEDHNGNIWIGMEDMGINRIDKNNNRITKVINESSGLSFNNVHDLLFETPSKMWIATYTGGANILNLKTNQFEYINIESHPQLPSNVIYHLLHCGDSMYLSTAAGIGIYNLENKTMSRIQDSILSQVQVEFMHDEGDRIWFSSYAGVFFMEKGDGSFHKFEPFSHLKRLNFVKTDSKGRIWAGDCLEGLWGYNTKTDSIFAYNEKSGFPFSWIFSLEEGKNDNLWVSGDKGLVRFNPETGEQVWFNRESGLPFEQFNFRASYKDKNGDIYFGGNNGMVSFNVDARQDEGKELDVVFRGMQLFNQELIPGTNIALSQSLNLHPEICLKYKENVFTIEYSGLNYQNQGKCQYAYYLENFENDWNYVGDRDFATYTNLSPGEYYFHVKASTDNTNWGEHANTLKLTIEPPFWLSNWGFFIYFLIVILLLVMFYLVTTRIQKSKALAEMERREKEYLTELNNFKLEFFTNVSHELRTPLTLVVGPLTRILEEEKLTPALSKKMKGIKNNAHRLLTLINQLLEFRKIETGKEKLRVAYQEIDSLLKNIEEAFDESADTKGIELTFEKRNLDTSIWIDGQKFENILVNLVSNALKYTKEGGEVKVYTKLLVRKNEKKRKLLRIIVSDTGVGIESAKLNRIFDRFYRAEGGDNTNNGGSGIGLAFVNSLVKLHKGTIKVESKVGAGSVFTVEIPVSRKAYKDNEIVFGTNQYVVKVDPVENEKHVVLVDNEAEKLRQKPVVLVIDDNRELLEFITETLEDNYTVLTAIDGTQGLEKVEQDLPDLIISDVMMPGIDGFELARKLKGDIRTSHIPIVLLTAKSGEENEYEGLRTGADYYIEKPFLPHILSKIVENILNTRKSLIDRFKSDVSMLPTDVAVSESDKELIERITALIQNNIDIPNLDVSFIVNEIGISRSLLHTKLKKLTDCSATEFIRSIRLREAVKLIADGKCNISEAAYRTGFSSPAYFSRRFKEYFGVTPKAYFEK